MARKVLHDVTQELVNGFVQLPAHGEGPRSYLGSPQRSVRDTVLQCHKLCLGACVLPNHGTADCDELCFGSAELIEVRSLTTREFSNAVSVAQLLQWSFTLHYHCLEVTRTVVNR